MPKYTKQFLLRGVLFMVLLVAGIYQYRKYRVAPTLPTNDFVVETLNGKTIIIRPGQDGPLIVKFFATWCIDCRRELPELKAKAELFNQYKVRVILLSDEPLADLSFFSARESLPFPIYKLPKKFKEYGIHTLPTTYIYRKSGEISESYTNTKEISELDLKNLNE